MGKSSNKFEQVKVIAVIRSTPKEAFNAGLQADLADIFKKYGSLPRITGTNLKGAWTSEGLQRIIYFEDSTQVTETLLKIQPHRYFSYRVEKFTSALRYLARKIEGDWTFTQLGDKETKVEWNYNIYPKNSLVTILVKLVLKKDIKGYLTQALKIVKQNAETNKMSSDTFI